MDLISLIKTIVVVLVYQISRSVDLKLNRHLMDCSSSVSGRGNFIAQEASNTLCAILFHRSINQCIAS